MTIYTKSFYDKIDKKFLNSLTCPACKCGLDLGGSRGIGTSQQTGENYPVNFYYCVQIPYHYDCTIAFQTPPKITREIFIIIQDNKHYKIRKVYFPSAAVDNVVTTISIFSVDGNGDIIEGSEEKSLVLHDDCFDFRILDKHQILDRLKTVLISY